MKRAHRVRKDLSDTPAWLKKRRGAATRASALAKLAVSEAYVDCCRSAVQLFGGYGYMVDYELERELRDALVAG